MASWILVPCLASQHGLLGEFNALAPSRDRSSDGSIGDSAHASSSSDHNPDETGATPSEDADFTNEVHAIDVTANLRKAGWSMARAVEIIVTRHRTGKDNRLQNVIYNGRIWSRSWGWKARVYTGSNKHKKHAHFSSRYTTAQERDTRSWGLLEADKPAPPTEEDGMDAAEFFASAAKGARGGTGVTAANRTHRNDAVTVVRFALGLEADEVSDATLPSGPGGQLDRIEKAVTGTSAGQPQTQV